ncbi:hypothetical protein SAMN05216359_111103 [Roseateles sp. YR242]|uniref:DUF4304 domain-containing protein n=1 Tax=Roseateles sp. YR242 TaxID=1855305 RepID=UPI0008C7B0A2|nr:DUF4304 domain-containing protein [Roseateles sp. YR242]SEL57423.1 hypothetical protein SAMN05216359_111103 [Roseateles sp. YR242]
MKRNKSLAQKAISLLLKPHGFEKHGSVWALDLGDTLLGVHLQGSRFAAGRAYVNFLAWYKALSTQPLTSFKDDFHLSFRGDDVHQDDIQAALTFDDSEVEFDTYVARLNELFFSKSLQKLLSLSTLEAAIAAVRADEMRGYSLELWNAAHPGAPVSACGGS